MIETYRYNKDRVRGPYYTFNYPEGGRATLAVYQGEVCELCKMARDLSEAKGREIRIRRHVSGRSSLVAVCRTGRNRRNVSMSKQPKHRTNLCVSEEKAEGAVEWWHRSPADRKGQFALAEPSDGPLLQSNGNRVEFTADISGSSMVIDEVSEIAMSSGFLSISGTKHGMRSMILYAIAKTDRNRCARTCCEGRRTDTETEQEGTGRDALQTLQYPNQILPNGRWIISAAGREIRSRQICIEALRIHIVRLPSLSKGGTLSYALETSEKVIHPARACRYCRPYSREA